MVLKQFEKGINKALKILKKEGTQEGGYIAFAKLAFVNAEALIIEDQIKKLNA